MARPRDSRRDEAFQIWKESNGNKKLKDIADQLGCSPSQIRKWKNQDKWEYRLNGNVTNQHDNSNSNVTKRGAPKGNKNAKGNKGGKAPHGNKNAVGNRGGAAPKGNANAVKHGLFAKYLPKETLEIVNQFGDNLSPLEILWSNIQMLFASILRAQQIMFVETREEMIKELKKAKYEYHEIPKDQGGGIEKAVTEEEYEFQFSWDRHATFMNSQSRAFGELRSTIKQFVELADRDDDRLLEIKRINAVIEKTKVETDKLNGDKNNEETKEWVDAIKAAAKRRLDKKSGDS